MKRIHYLTTIALTFLLVGGSFSSISAQDIAPSLTVAEQTIEGRQVTIPEAIMAQDGWVVIHDSDADGNIIVPDIISEPVSLAAGTSTDIAVTLTKDIDDGHKLFAMLHIDDGVIGTYEFPAADPPVQIDGNVVVQPFTVSVAGEMADEEAIAADEPAADEEAMADEAAMADAMIPSLTVTDQDVVGRQITIPGAVMAQDGWVVIHDSDPDGNIIVPGIISEPKALAAGTSTDIVVTLTQDITGDHKLFAMLHIDDGAIGTYEFPAADPPVEVDGNVVVSPFVASLASPTTMPVTGTGQPSSVPWLLGALALMVLGGAWFMRHTNIARE